jgi:hypothetical protein
MCVVQVDASQGRRGRDTGPYVDRGERCEAPHGRRTSVADSWRRALTALGMVRSDHARRTKMSGLTDAPPQAGSLLSVS